MVHGDVGGRGRIRGVGGSWGIIRYKLHRRIMVRFGLVWPFVLILIYLLQEHKFSRTSQSGRVRKASTSGVPEFNEIMNETVGESYESFCIRASGKPLARIYGGPTDLAVYTQHEDIRVMVIDTKMILSTTSDADLWKCVTQRVFLLSAKRLGLSGVLSRDHFDLGIVRNSENVRAVFKQGDEWQDALRLILLFIKSRVPSDNNQPRDPLVSQWVPTPPSPVFLQSDPITPAK